MIEESLQSLDHSPEPPTPESSEASEVHCAEIAAIVSEADQSSVKLPSHGPPIPRWLFNLVGHVVAGAVGLLLGYLILNRLRPDVFPLPW